MYVQELYSIIFCFFSTVPTSRLNHDPAMTGQKPGRTIRSFAKRIGEGVQSSTANVACATWERNLARRAEDISGSNIWRFFFMT